MHVVEKPLREASECMNDVVKNVQEELIKVSLNDEGEESLVKISKSLPEGERRKLVALLKEYKDVFAWNFEEMPGLNPKLVTHKLNIDPKSHSLSFSSPFSHLSPPSPSFHF